MNDTIAQCFVYGWALVLGICGMVIFISSIISIIKHIRYRRFINREYDLLYHNNYDFEVYIDDNKYGLDNLFNEAKGEKNK